MRVMEAGPVVKHVTLERETNNRKERYLAIRQYTVEICRPLCLEDYVIQPAEFVSPPKWHLAHTTWFFEEFMLSKLLLGYKRFNEKYAFLFNSYYNTVGDRVLRLDRGNFSRPTVEEVLNYRRHVDKYMTELLDTCEDEGISPILEIGINHEQQHQELLFADIKYILGHNVLFPVYKTGFCETTRNNRDEGFTPIPQGEYSIGYSGYGFSYDNEHGKHQVMLKPFEISKRLVTNREFLEFIEDRGYQRWEFWMDDGLQWIKKNEIESPMYWHRTETGWEHYTLGGIEPVQLEDPVTHVSFYEAAAFASWRGMRLPTEFEWEAAADQFEWGQRWEHTNSAYLPYPGYQRASGAIGEYNGKFMINTMILRGASVVTPPNHSRKTYRNFFTPDMRWQFNGIRLCRDVV